MYMVRVQRLLAPFENVLNSTFQVSTQETPFEVDGTCRRVVRQEVVG